MRRVRCCSYDREVLWIRYEDEEGREWKLLCRITDVVSFRFSGSSLLLPSL